jgi:hypothetical protein
LFNFFNGKSTKDDLKWLLRFSLLKTACDR